MSGWCGYVFECFLVSNVCERTPPQAGARAVSSSTQKTSQHKVKTGMAAACRASDRFCMGTKKNWCSPLGVAKCGGGGASVCAYAKP